MSAPWVVLWRRLVEQPLEGKGRDNTTLDSLLLALEQKPPLTDEVARL